MSPAWLPLSKVLFIVALILICEVSFRLWPAPPRDANGNYIEETQYYFYPLNHHETKSIRWHVYLAFEHVKVLLFAWIAAVVFSRCSFLIWMFAIDLVIFLLNYDSTLFYWGIFPIGADTIKLFIFGIVAIREALNYYNGFRYANHNEHRSFIAYAHGHVSKKVRVFALSGLLAGVKKTIFGDHHRGKTSTHESN